MNLHEALLYRNILGKGGGGAGEKLPSVIFSIIEGQVRTDTTPAEIKTLLDTKSGILATAKIDNNSKTLYHVYYNDENIILAHLIKNVLGGGFRANAIIGNLTEGAWSYNENYLISE